MTDANLLALVKLNLSLASNAYDTLLSHDITVAKAEIKREGITLTDDIGDANLIIMYACYLWGKRKSAEQTMPRMLRYALNNRLFAQKMEGC